MATVEEFQKFMAQLKKHDKLDAYKMGYDCGLNGANTTNCHFSLFSTAENTAEWERGKRAGEKRANKSLQATAKAASLKKRGATRRA